MFVKMRDLLSERVNKRSVGKRERKSTHHLTKYARKNVEKNNAKNIKNFLNPSSLCYKKIESFSGTRFFRLKLFKNFFSVCSFIWPFVSLSTNVLNH